MIGARALLTTLLASGVDTCFMNPGTSEMHFVAALDDVPEMRSVLTLFEGVATGAADGYGRMTGRPAATLVHLGPGLANGLANLHNARRARTPIVNIVGDHATYHQPYDAPLQSDIESLAASVSCSVIRPQGPDRLGADTARAVADAIAPLGGVATLILPADISWSEGADPADPVPARAGQPVDAEAVMAAAKALRDDGSTTAFLVGGDATRGEPLSLLAGAAQRFGARTICETFPARLSRGAGIPPLIPLPYLAEMAADVLAGLDHLILAGARSPVSFFAYPGKPSDLVPAGCTVHQLSGPGLPVGPAVAALASELDIAAATWRQADAERPGPPSGAGPLTPEAINQAVGALLPEAAIVSDESATSGFRARGHSAGAPPHEWLTLTGGAIGQGLPVAVGAAVACPGRRVVALQADGGSLYTIQSLWTMAREGLDVVTVLYNNRSYAILNMELDRVGAGAGGPRARAMLDLSDPDLDFVALATGLGVPASRALCPDEFVAQFATALESAGPHLIEAII